MKKQTLILAFTLVFQITFSQQKDVKQLSAEFDKILANQYKPNETGATVLIARKGQVIYKKAFGMANLELDVPMKTDNVFRIGSITKQFTAIVILQLLEQGKLDLNDEITKYIQDYPTQGNKITIEHLLTHTSGIRDYSTISDTAKKIAGDVTPLQMIDFFKNQPMRFAPGTRWEYSNSGYYILGYIIEKITGKPYGEYLEENIFKLLGMSNSSFASDIRIIKNRADGYTKNENNKFENAAYISMTHPYAAGSILSTVEDLFKWQQAVQFYKLIKKENVEKAFSRYKLIDGKETNYGYGWRLGYIQESPSLWHGGLVNGFIAMSMYLPKENVFVAVFTNCECNSPVDITAKLAAITIGQPYDFKEIPVANTILPSYTGVYENRNGQQRIITISGNKLFSQLNRSPKTNIKAYQKDRFFFDDEPMLTMEFTRNKNGEIEKLITRNRSAIEMWNKTNKSIPAEDGIRLDEKILENYLGVYEVAPEFSFTVTKEKNRIFLQATGQEKLEIFAETENKFFLKVNDAQIEFVKDNSGRVIKAVLNQGGRSTDAKKIK
ncbi:MAG: serine hydrolase [Flavisolibacter sp.]